MSAELADALIRIGVRSSGKLAGENPDRVQNKLAALVEKGVLAEAPARAAVAEFIENASEHL